MLSAAEMGRIALVVVSATVALSLTPNLPIRLTFFLIWILVCSLLKPSSASCQVTSVAFVTYNLFYPLCVVYIFCYQYK